MDVFYFLRYRVLAERWNQSMIDTKIFDLLYAHLEERTVNNVRDQLNSDADYQEAMSTECELYQDYENLNLPKELCQIIEQ